MHEELISSARTPEVAPDVRERNQHSCSTRDGLFCALILAACVLATVPVANMPFSDGFSYAKTALEFARTGHIVYNGWATAMLGWLIFWGALFIKLFGFSFTVMRLSMLPIDMATAFLLHQILRRFGINSSNAVFGTLALTLSPIFLPSATSFMTDVPGLLVILICIYMCQRAVTAPSDEVALLWLSSAMVVNVAGGTVRQIAWLGALVMVPSTAWLLRERRGMKIAGIVLWLLSLGGVLACLHWFNSQPYSVPEHIIWGPIDRLTLPHLAAEIVKTFCCLLLVILPVTVAWLPAARQWNRTAWMRFAAFIVALSALWVLAYSRGRIGTWIMPWLMFLLAEQSSLMPGMFGTHTATMVWIRLVISLFVLATAFIMAEQIVSRRQDKRLNFERAAISWKGMAWILVPFSLSYFLLLLPRGAFDQIQDRYLVGLTPAAVVFLLRLYQDRIKSTLPAVSLITLAVFALYSVAGTHDLFSESRAQVSAIQMVEASGVPRRSIQAGFPSDGWVQIENGGHINESRIQVPAGTYDPSPPLWKMLPDGCRDGFTKFAPVIRARYFVLFPWFKNPPDPLRPWCFTPASYPPIDYTTWLPPFHRTLYVQQLAHGLK